MRNTTLNQLIATAEKEIEKSIEAQKKAGYENPDTTIVMKWPLDGFSIPEYQRAVDNNRISKMYANFDWNLVQIKQINIRDGKAWILNGLQTYYLLKKLADEGKIEPYMTVKVSYGLTYEQEAEIFIRQYENCSRVRQVEMFNAAEKAEITWAVELRKLFKKLKVTTIRGTKAKRYNINAIGKVLQIYYLKNGGIDAVEMALRLIIESGFAEFDGGFTTIMLEIGCEAARLGVTYRDNNYMEILKAMRTAENPDKFIGITKETYPSNSGQHGEGSVKLYVRHLMGLIA